MTGRIPREFIDDLLTRTDIAEIIDARVPLRKAGKEFMACCPFHDEKTPSFTVSPAKQFYYCFGCGANGNAISFLINFERQSFVEAVTTLAQFAGIEIPFEKDKQQSARYEQAKKLYPILEDAAAYFEKNLCEHTKAKAAVDYLKARGLTGKICKTYRVGFVADEWDGLSKQLAKNKTPMSEQIRAGLVIKNDKGKCYDRFRQRIIFPIRDKRGQVIAFGGRTLDDSTPKYLNSPETPVFNKSKSLYGLYEALQANRSLIRLIVVEGYMDVIALAQAGISFAVASLGTAFSKDHFVHLQALTDEVVICFDGDAAGHKAAWRALTIALALQKDGHQVRFLFLPKGEDPDSFVRKEGRDAFLARVNKAKTLSDVFFGYLKKQTDLSTVEGRTKLVSIAEPHLNTLPQGVFRDLMCERLAQLTQLGSDRIKSMLDPQSPAPAPERKVIKASANLRIPKGYSPIHRLISVLLQYPSFAKFFPKSDALNKIDHPEIDLLKEIVDLLQQKPNLTPGAILEHWRDQSNEALLARFVAKPLLLDEQALKQECQDLVSHLLSDVKTQDAEQQLRELTQKHPNNLSSEEKALLQQILLGEREPDA